MTSSYDNSRMARRRPLPGDGQARHASSSSYSSSQGLPGIVAVAVITVGSVVGALFDVTTGTGLRTGYGLGFVAGCVLAALLVRMQDKLWAVFAPSLVFTAFAVLGAIQAARDLGRGLVSLETISETFLRLIDAGKAPYLLAGFSLSLALILVRMALVRK